MRKLPLIGLASALLAGCTTAQPELFKYSERVSVHSVLPVHVQMHEAYDMQSDTPDPDVAFDASHQNHLVASLKSELVNHGIFGSISETGGDNIFNVDVNFSRLASFPGSSHYKLSVGLATEYRSERDFKQYHVLFMNAGPHADEDPAASNRKAAAELMNLLIGDIQQAVADRKVSLKAHVKEKRMTVPRVLVKW